MTDFTTIDDLLAAIDHERQPVEIMGHTIQIQPPTVLQCVRLVKRFPKLIDIFDDKVDKSGKPLPPELQPNMASILVDAGGEAVAAFVACAVGKEADAGFEKTFSCSPDSLTVPMFAAAVKATLRGGTLDDFFTRLVATLEATGALGTQSATESQTAEAA